ncbi:MAG: uracil-DNA glycosylase [Planctomycetes bacterium]|nr:uracil-DNA glycosylase [Planctomycetota bacterium]
MPLDPARELRLLSEEIVLCRRCPRLAAYREEVARVKRRAYRDQEYWGRPVPGFGDPRSRLLVLGLAPAAHGANRTGRMFTGDRSGEWLYRALHKAGFASQPASASRDDGLELRDCYVTASCRCAPPDNKPLKVELDSCRAYVVRELEVLRRVRVILALGAIAFDTALRVLVEAGAELPRPRPRFAHGAVVRLGEGFPAIVASFHPSQQNTQTGRLTETMLDQAVAKARALLGEAR